MQRRDFLRTAAGTGGATAAAGAAATPAAAQETEGGGGGSSAPPDLGGYLDNVTNFSGVQDMRGQDEVTVQVGVEANGGPYGFGPAAVHVDNGATVKFEWTGNGQHNVVAENGAFESDLYTASGVNFEHTFGSDGVYNYYCQPHKGLGMKGSIVVGEDIPRQEAGGGPTPLDPKHMGVPFQAHFVGFATLLAVSMSLVFTFYLLKYGESAHTKGGNN